MPLSPLERAGFMKVGDALIPGGEGMPAFSEQVDLSALPRMMDYFPEEDRVGLLILMRVLGTLPKLVISAFLRVAQLSAYFPQPLRALLRKVDLGLKGVAFTLYYSEKTIHDHIQWDAQIVERKSYATTGSEHAAGARTGSR